MIKALFFDIDGTLVSFRTHTIPTSTLEAVSEARRRGVKVFIATGRPRVLINNLGEMEYDGIMSSNGAVCTLNDGTTLHRATISRADIRRIVDHQRSHPMPIGIATDTDFFACDWEVLGDSAPQVWRLLNNPAPPQRPITDALGLDVVQVIPFFTLADEPRILSEVLLDSVANRWHPLFADCIAQGNSKATGIAHICRRLGIDVADTMAFGDGGNDIEMLDFAGIGVAMGNASDEVKRHADYVTADVDEDGVAQALTKFLL